MLDWLFPESTDMGLGALCFMMAVYAYILVQASGLISHGCEMLLLLYGPGIVGGLVLPILGAVPDCAVILISGMGGGTQAEIQAQVSIGVGALVGSTIFIITLPWAAAVYLGRRDYDPETDTAAVTASNRPKLTHFGWSTNCVTTLSDIPYSARVMVGVAASYLIVQLPAMAYGSRRDDGAREERPFEIAALVSTAICFAFYCWSQVASAHSVDMDRRKQEALRREQWKKNLDNTISPDVVFKMFDRDNSGYMEPAELSAALAHLGLKVDRRDLPDIIAAIDIGHEEDKDGAGDGKISLIEFKTAVNIWVSGGQTSSGLKASVDAHHKQREEVQQVVQQGQPLHGADAPRESTPLQVKPAKTVAEASGDCEEEEEEEDQQWHLSDKELNMQAIIYLLIGTVIVGVFTEPMVDCLANTGARLSISPYYLSFMIVPLISNASELIAGLQFAKKKTNESISMTLSSFHGTASINSTLCLFLFVSIIYFRHLAWSYTAEVITVLIIIVLVGLQAMRRNIFMWNAALVASLYPISILLVWTMESVFGMS